MLRLLGIFCPISFKWDLDIGKILYTSCFIEHEQFDFSLLVNGKSIERKVSTRREREWKPSNSLAKKKS